MKIPSGWIARPKLDRKGIKVEMPLILYEEKDVYSEEMRRDYGF